MSVTIMLETETVTLAALIELAEAGGHDPEAVFVQYAGCGSHNVEIGFVPKKRLIPVDDDFGYDERMGF